MACHVLDGVFWALKLGEAKTYTVECLTQTPGSQERFAQNNVLRWTIPARAGMPPLKVFSYDHDGNKPEILKQVEADNGHPKGIRTLYVGTKGFMATDTYGDGVRILPVEKHNAFAPPAKTLPRANGHPVQDLFHAIKNGGSPCSNFVDSSGPFSEFVLTGLLAMAAGPGVPVEWDVKAMQPSVAALEPLVRRSYRPGWEV